MAYCGPRGIPHSVFMSWDPLDQDKALASLLAERTRCQQCGTVPNDWLDEDGKYREPPPYVAVVELCAGCQLLREKIETVPEEQRGYQHIYLVPKGVVDGEHSRQDRTPS